MKKFPDGSFASTYRFALLLIVMFELLSLVAFFVPWVSSAAFLAILVIVAVLAVVRFDLAVLALLGELFVGSQGGYMLTFGASSGLDLSIRHGLFLIIVAVWFAELLAASFAGGDRRTAAWEWWRRLRSRGLLWPYVALVAAIAFGIFRGILHHNAYSVIFFDVDRSLYYALFPALVVAFAVPRMRTHTAAVLCAAVTAAVAKVLIVLFFFSHRVFSVAKNLYVWIRDTRVGEITIMVADFYRIFFQSQIFILASVFAAALLFAYAASLKDRRARRALAFVCWSMVSMVLSLSRSFWFGGAAAVAALIVLLIWAKAEAKIWKRLVALGIGSVAVAVTIVAVLYWFPFPNKAGSLSIATLLGERAMSLTDAAAASRWDLLPKLTAAAMKYPIFGSGYGTTVTYLTHDPRLLASNETGSYTTYAFEWGYLDLWLKMGAFGIAIYGWFVVMLLAPLVRLMRASRAQYRTADLGSGDQKKLTALIAAGLFIGVIALLATNVFSPYLNHPLGIGILMMVGALACGGMFDGEKNDAVA
jgi:O-antigen ligase